MTRPKLLLADDSVTIRKVIELTFADEGIDVTSVADGSAAMAKFVEIEPDIVLVDAGLPGTSGYQICEMIKGDDSTAHIPVLLLIGSFEPFDQDAAERAGADGFLTKPFHSIRELVNRVQELLGQSSPQEGEELLPISVEGPAAADTQDITELYEQSFAETQPIEQYETVPAYESHSLDATVSDATIDGSHHSVEEWLDDEMIETVRNGSAEAASEEAVEDPAAGAATALQATAGYETAPAAAIDIEPIKEFDWSPAAIVTSANEAEIGAAAGFVPMLVPEESFIPPISDPPPPATVDLQGSDAVTFPNEEPSREEANPIDAEDERRGGGEPSPELIELIAKRVIERLSDRVIREVAQEAVPRIAEKMMREALEEERKA